VKPPILLDGGMGQELIRRGANRKSDMWAAWALVHDPELVTAVHTDYIAAGVTYSPPTPTTLLPTALNMSASETGPRNSPVWLVGWPERWPTTPAVT